MKKEILVTPNKLEKISDENTSNDYLKRVSYQKVVRKTPRYSEEQINFIQDQVHKLEDSEKALVHLVFWENLSVEEISYRTRKRVATIQKELLKVIEKLKQQYFEDFPNDDQTSSSFSRQTRAA